MEARELEGQWGLSLPEGVELTYGAYRILVPGLEVDEHSQTGWTEGDVRLWGPNLTARADAVAIDFNRSQFDMKNMSGRAGPWRVRAEQALGGRGFLEMRGVRLTSCEGSNPVLQMQAREMSYQSSDFGGGLREDRFVARGVIPRIKGVPVFYLPRYTYEVVRTEEGEYVQRDSRYEVHPGKSSYTGIYLRNIYRMEFLQRRLKSASHFDWYLKPGFGIGEDIRYENDRTSHESYLYLIRQKRLSREGGRPRKVGGSLTRSRFRHRLRRGFEAGPYRGAIRTYANLASDSAIDEDYDFDFIETRRFISDREVRAEATLDGEHHRFAVSMQRFESIQSPSSQYQADEIRMPGLRFTTFQVPMFEAGGFRFYSQGSAEVANGRDRRDRPTGGMGGASLGGTVKRDVTDRISTALHGSLQSEYQEKRVGGQQERLTRLARVRADMNHRAGRRTIFNTGYEWHAQFNNRSMNPVDDGERVNQFDARWSNYGRSLRTELLTGYDFRRSRRALMPFELHARSSGELASLSAILRYDSKDSRLQSIYGGWDFRPAPDLSAGLSFQAIESDTLAFKQLGQSLRWKTPNRKYLLEWTAHYDYKTAKWRERRLELTRIFDCLRVKFKIAKRGSDLRFDFTFGLATTSQIGLEGETDDAIRFQPIR